MSLFIAIGKHTVIFFKYAVRQISNFMDYGALKESSIEVLLLTLIAFFPLISNIIFEYVKVDTLKAALFSKVSPSELLAFCISFLAPSIFFLKKSHGEVYKLPLLNIYFFSTIGMYILCFLFVFIIKNNLEPMVVKNIGEKNKYLTYSIIFLFTTIIFRIYSIYHSKKTIDFKRAQQDDQNEFNEQFKKSIK